MNKSALFLIAAFGITAAIALIFKTDLDRERARANALAERVAVLEPVERDVTSPRERESARHPTTPLVATEYAVERPSEQAPSSEPDADNSEPKVQFRGSADARAQIARLQNALIDGTPLQDYQVQALMTAIDEARADGQPADSREGLINAAADILFESQLEKFIEILEAR